MFKTGFPGGSVVKDPPVMQETQEMRVRFLGQEGPLEEGMTTLMPIPVFLLRKSHGQGSLAGYSPWSSKESDITECTHTHILPEILSLSNSVMKILLIF